MKLTEKTKALMGIKATMSIDAFDQAMSQERQTWEEVAANAVAVDKIIQGMIHDLPIAIDTSNLKRAINGYNKNYDTLVQSAIDISQALYQISDDYIRFVESKEQAND